MSEIGMSKFLKQSCIGTGRRFCRRAGQSIGFGQRPDGNSQRKHFCKCSNDGGNDDTFNEICWIRTGICRRGRVCVASAGGQIMPPVMGAAAFLMAQFIGVQYSVIVFAAIIPAFLYYLCVWVSVSCAPADRD